MFTRVCAWRTNSLYIVLILPTLFKVFGLPFLLTRCKVMMFI